jgi:hypothetical protein
MVEGRQHDGAARRRQLGGQRVAVHAVAVEEVDIGAPGAGRSTFTRGESAGMAISAGMPSACAAAASAWP